jgi:ankyrin repeat protein
MPPKPLSKVSAFETLIQGCINGDLAKVTQAVTSGADVNKKTPDNKSPLYIAVDGNHTPIVKHLLSKGARIDEINDDGGFTALMNTCFSGSLDIARVLIDAGADVNLKSTDGYTPLFLAVQEKHKPVIEYLLSKGARVDEKNGPDGVTALMNACFDESLDMLMMLVDAGADVNLKSNEGYTPLYNAVQAKETYNIEYLLSKGARIDEKCGPHGLTALFKACTDGALYVAKNLVDAGADVNLKTTQGFTPLFVAVQEKHKPVVEYLLSKGANIDEKNGDGEFTALYKACFDGSFDIVSVLVDAGADASLKSSGKTPLEIAIENNHKEVVEYLRPWAGFTQSDISKFDTIFQTEAPEGQVPPAVNFSCCPVCLKFVERSEACMYMSHKCTGNYHKELYAKYANDDGKIYWCTICGRVCFGHRHYRKTNWNSRKPTLLPAGEPFENDCRISSGGGGLEEKFARIRALRNTAFNLQSIINTGETVTVKRATYELVQQCWNAAPGAITTRIMTQKAWNRPLSNFRPNIPPAGTAAAAAAPPAFVYPKDDPDAYEAPRILAPGNADFGANAYTGDDSEPVMQFRHKKANGTMFTHPLLNKETLLMFISGSGSEWPCFEPACGGHLWPAEVIQALEDPALAATDEEKAKAQAYKERVHGPQHAVGGRLRRRKTQRRRRH